MTLQQRDLENKAIGRAEGHEAGVLEGHKEGLEEGREEGIRALVNVWKKVSGEKLDAVESIMSEMNLSQEEAERLVKKYW